MLKGIYKIKLIWEENDGSWTEEYLMQIASSIEESIAIVRKKIRKDVEIISSELKSVINFK